MADAAGSLGSLVCHPHRLHGRLHVARCLLSKRGTPHTSLTVSTALNGIVLDQSLQGISYQKSFSQTTPSKLLKHCRQPVLVQSLFVYRPASSKEAVHDAPEVVEAWLYNSPRPTTPRSPYSEGETVVSGFQPLEVDQKGDPHPPRRQIPPRAKPGTCGLPRRHFICVIILLWVLLVAVALGVGLGIGLKKKHS